MFRGAIKLPYTMHFPGCHKPTLTTLSSGLFVCRYRFRRRTPLSRRIPFRIFRHRGNWIHQMLADPYSDHDYYFSNRQRAPFERKLHKTTNFRLLLSHSEIERLRQEFEISDPFPYVFGIPIFEPLSKVENRINCRRAMFNKLIDEKASELKIDWEKVPPDEDWQHLRSNTRMIYRHKTEDCCHLVYSDGIRYTYLDSSFEYVYGVLFSDVFSGESSE